MDTLFFHYFSATGNTGRAVRLCADELAKSGHQVSLVPITTESMRHPATAHHTAVHVIAFPVLGFGAPHLVKQYLRHLSRVVTKETGLRAAVLATWGGAPFQALEETVLMLRRRGFEVLMSGGGRYADNWTQLSSAETDEKIAGQTSAGDEAIRAYARRLGARLLGGSAASQPSGPAPLYRTAPFNRVWSGLVQLLFTSLGRRFLGTFFVADKRCNACGLCAKQCPVGTIKMTKGRPVWGANCMCCNRCINTCPQQAIQVSIPILALQTTINLAALVAAIRLVPGLVDPLGLPPVIHGPFELAFVLALFALASLIQALPLNWLLQRLARTKALNGFFALSWTKGYRRYPGPKT